MTRTPFLFAVISLVLLTSELPAGAAVRLDRAERAAIRHINNFRAAHGRPPVYPARSLNRSAETLIAASRGSRVSRARYTSPMPPAPMVSTITYAPRRVFGDSGIWMVGL